MIQISSTATWAKNGITIAGDCGTGEELNRLNRPEGLIVDDDGTVFIADTGNHRIVAWKQDDSKEGHLVAGGNGEGDRPDQLDDPTDIVIDKETDSLIICDRGNRRVVRWCRLHGTTRGEIVIDNIRCCGLAMDDEGNLYVTDTEKHEVKRYQRGENIGIVVAGGNGEGHGLNQLNSPNRVCIDKEGAVYVSDYDNHRVMKWARGAREGIVVAGGREEGEDLKHLSCPQGIVVDAENTLYVADMANHRVIKWPSGMRNGEVIAGGNGDGKEANQFTCPLCLSFNRHGDLYVTDWENHRVQLFHIDKTI